VALYHYADRQGWSDLDAPVLLAQSDGAGSGPDFKVCADSSRVSVFQCTYGFPASPNANLALRIKEDPLGTQPETYGQAIRTYPYAENSVGFRYHHPWVPPAQGALYRAITLQVYDHNSGSVLVEHPLRVYRAPVIFVHGWDGAYGTMEGLHQSMDATGQWPEALMENYDFNALSYRTFYENRYIVPGLISEKLDVCRRTGYAAGKVDAIAHSMGGILARLYLQSSWGGARAKEYQGDLFRLITVDTPHFGSQEANFIQEVLTCNEGGFGDAMRAVRYWLGMNEDPVYTGGACADLAVNSAGIVAALNGANSINRAVVPSRAVVCVGSPARYMVQYPTESWWAAIVLPALALGVGDDGRDGMQAFVDLLFNGEDSDAIVPVSSQAGGLASIAGPFLGQAHSGAPGNSRVKDDIIATLNERPESSVWSSGGFGFTQLTYQPRCPAGGATPRQNADATLALTGGIITSPEGPVTANPGQDISIELNGPSGTASILVVTSGAAQADSMAWLLGSSATYSLHVPMDVMGSMRVFAFAADGAGIAAFDSLDVNVEVTAGLTSLAFRPATGLWAYQDNQSVAALYGSFSDGYSRALNRVPGVTWWTDGNGIAEVDGHGIVSGLAGGEARVYASYMGDTTSVAVHIANRGTLVPTFISSFVAQPSAGGVTLTWRLGDGGAPGQFRLLGNLGPRSWDVPITAQRDGSFTARDDAPILHGAGEVVYRLQLGGTDGVWRTVWEERVILGNVPAVTVLGSARPNPFNPLTRIDYDLASPRPVKLTIYDAMGRLIRRLVKSEGEAAGRHEVAWDGRSDSGAAMPSGVYFCRLEAGDYVQTIKLALFK
jgi:hypothetical protein